MASMGLVEVYKTETLRIHAHSSLTFKKPVGVTLFGAVGLEEGEDILCDIFHHPSGES